MIQFSRFWQGVKEEEKRVSLSELEVRQKDDTTVNMILSTGHEKFLELNLSTKKVQNTMVLSTIIELIKTLFSIFILSALVSLSVEIVPIIGNPVHVRHFIAGPILLLLWGFIYIQSMWFFDGLRLAEAKSKMGKSNRTS